jgi:ATP-dependent Clp protease adaptor protein ClpS
LGSATLYVITMATKEKIQEQIDLALAQERVNQHEIVMYNDDVNTFDHVIETLMRVCHHTAEQAEQCSLIIHYKGKCTVKTGELDELIPQCTQLLEAGLSAEIV